MFNLFKRVKEMAIFTKIGAFCSKFVQNRSYEEVGMVASGIVVAMLVLAIV